MRSRLLVPFLLCVALPNRAAGQTTTFTASTDRTAVPIDDTFIYEVTLRVSDGKASDFQPPEFRGVRVLAQRPSQSTQIQMSPGRTFMLQIHTWRYELQPLRKGTIVIGSARVRVGGRELRTAAVSVSVGEAGAAPPPVGTAPGEPPAAETPARDSFLRVVTDKTKAFVGEQVTVGWFLYLTERHDKYQTLSEPRTDPFWTEDLPVPSMRTGLALKQENYNGRNYEVAPLLRKALFPLQAGKLTVGAMESEISQVDFFGAALRSQRLRADPLVIEVVPLPTQGRPKTFDPGNVGRFTVLARVDRPRVAVGEAATILFEIKGRGNLRNVKPPAMPKLDGWKSYEPKVSLSLDAGEAVAGTKAVEYLVLPERPGTVTVPEIELAYFDPESRGYETAKSAPIVLEATGEAAVAAGGGPRGVAAAGVENVLPSEIRPVHARAALRRDLGTTLYGSRVFIWILIGTPAAFGLTLLFDKLREVLAQDTERTKRRRVHRLVRERLGAAEKHLREKRPEALYIEIDRVVRTVLAARLGRVVTGLRNDELRSLLGARGMAPALADQVLAELERCDRARFAPGSVGDDEMQSALDRAGELILVLEKAKLTEEKAA